MSEYIKKEIGFGAALLCIPATRFKTNEIAVSLAMPLCADTAADYALAVSMLSRKSKAYPDLTALNLKKDMLYGAQLSATVQKIGECQVMKLGVTCLDDRFSLDQESISAQGLELLLSLLFEPLLDADGLFAPEDVEAEKRVLLEKLAAEENDKRVYAVRRMEEIMFAQEPYGVSRYGTKDTIAAATPQSVTAAWKTMLTRAKVWITVVGSMDPDFAEKMIARRFSAVQRQYKPLPQTVFVPAAKKVRDVCESEQIKQGKLVLGFRVNMKPDDPRTAAMRSFCDAFGGGPYSKLFMNVREKMSLCYYCSARYVRQKSYVFIQCGCEEENMQKAVDEILNQLEEMKRGNCVEELQSSKIALSDLLTSVADTPSGLESWYGSCIAEEELLTPAESAAQNDAVTRDDVMDCAQLLTLDTVYKLVADKTDA